MPILLSLTASGTLFAIGYLALYVCRCTPTPKNVFFAQRVQLIIGTASNVLCSLVSCLGWSSFTSVLPLLLSTDRGLRIAFPAFSVAITPMPVLWSFAASAIWLFPSCYLAVCVCRRIRISNNAFSVQRLRLIVANTSNVLCCSVSCLAWSSLASVLPLMLSTDCGLLSLSIIGDVTVLRWLTLGYSGMLCVRSLAYYYLFCAASRGNSRFCAASCSACTPNAQHVNVVPIIATVSRDEPVHRTTWVETRSGEMSDCAPRTSLSSCLSLSLELFHVPCPY